MMLALSSKPSGACCQLRGLETKGCRVMLDSMTPATTAPVAHRILTHTSTPRDTQPVNTKSAFCGLRRQPAHTGSCFGKMHCCVVTPSTMQAPVHALPGRAQPHAETHHVIRDHARKDGHSPPRALKWRQPFKKRGPSSGVPWHA